MTVHGNHQHSPYEQNWIGFLKATKYLSIFVILVLVLMAIFLL